MWFDVGLAAAGWAILTEYIFVWLQIDDTNLAHLGVTFLQGSDQMLTEEPGAT